MVGLRWFWTQWDRLVGWAMIAIGATGLLIAAQQARSEHRLIDQFSYLMSGGLGSLAAGLVGCGFLFLAGLHDEWRSRHRVEGAIREGGGRGRPGAGTAPGDVAAPKAWTVVAAEGERIIGAALVAAAGLILLIGTRSALRSLFPTEQVAYVISGGLGALCLLIVGVALFVVAALRDEARKVGRIQEITGTPVGQSHRSERGTILLTLALSGLGGGAMVAAGWARAADATQLPRAMDGLVVAGIGIGLTAAGAIVTVLGQRRRLRRLALEVFSRFERQTDDAVLPTMREQDVRWSVSGLARFHRISCPGLASATGERVLVDPDTTTLQPCLLCGEAESA